MLKTGLVSVTFRKLPPEEIIQLVSKSGLDAIEWGGDIHVPHGDVKKAEEIANKCQEAGIKLPSYGSYYRVGCGNEVSPPFSAVLESALALGTNAIRVWAGNKGTNEADEAWWARVVEDGQRIADEAAKHNLYIDYEFHGNTLTDRWDMALKLYEAIGRSNVRSSWQPPTGAAFAEQKASLPPILPYLGNVHVFHWEDRKRLPLHEGESNWDTYIEQIVSTEREHYLMLEFVKNDDPEQYLEDANTLKSWLVKR